jgi:sigma-B regulation protein RsbU (phosphoserine phosphatase)
MSLEVEVLRKSLSIYKGLIEVSGLISSITDYDELLKAILDVARRVIRAEAASLFLVDEETGCLKLIIASAADGEFVRPQISVPKGRGIVGWVFEHGQSQLVVDAYADDRFYKEADRQTGFHTRSILCAPLKRDGEIIGVLQTLNPRDKVAFEEADLEAFTAYATLTATAIDKLRTQERMRAQERVDRDLAIASDIQHELLSRAVPSAIPGTAFAAHNIPASNVGGDFYSVHPRETGEIYFAIADVSGKGIAASLLMAQTLSVLQFVFAETTSPSDALEKLNATLYERIVRGMFITMLIGRVTLATGRVDLSSAGHCKPIVVRSDGQAQIVETTGALPLGILPSVTYGEITVDLHKGDWLVCYTDGLSESRNPESGEFFEDGFLRHLENAPFPTPEHVVQQLVSAERQHRGTGAQHDDLTIIAGGLV